VAIALLPLVIEGIEISDLEIFLGSSQFNNLNQE
jgi:hypothetical protein